MSTAIERLAVLETKVDGIIEEGHARESMQKDILEKLDELNDKMSKVESQISHYKGFIGGLIFFAGSVGTFLYYCGLPIYNFLSKLKTGQ